jgi:hypothetical protein
MAVPVAVGTSCFLLGLTCDQLFENPSAKNRRPRCIDQLQLEFKRDASAFGEASRCFSQKAKCK